jgi:DNA-binding MarR family transcriptional regulator
MMILVQNIAEALPEIIGSDERLASFAHDLGHALRTVDDEALRQVRNLLASVTVEDRHRSGMVSGVLEMIDGYRAAAAAHREEEAVAELCEGVSRDVLAELARRALTTSELAEALKISKSAISRALHRLRELDLVDARRDPLNGRVRPHRLSLQGRMLAVRAGLIPQVIDEIDMERERYREEREFEERTNISPAVLGGDCGWEETPSWPRSRRDAET